MSDALDYVLSGPLHIEMTRIIKAREELCDLRQKVADQTAEIERLTRLLDSGLLMWDDRCGGFASDRAEIDSRLPADPMWVIELDRGNTGWRDLLKGGAA